jgi:hypothetical protein
MCQWSQVTVWGLSQTFRELELQIWGWRGGKESWARHQEQEKLELED